MAQNNLEKPDTAQTDWGGTLGGPILKDRMHFFYSLDRLVYAEGRSNTFTARPELDYSNTQRMKLWNHMIRVDHQLNGNNSWSARYLVENSPTYDRISGRRAQVAKDQEFDIDRTVVATWNAVFGNTRFNTLRAAYTWEKNGFTAKEVQDGIPMTELPVSLTMLTFLDGFANGAQFRINGSSEVSDSYSWFVPGTVGRVARHQVRRAVHLFDHRAARPDRHERPVPVLDRSRVQPEQLPHLSGAPVHPRAGGERLLPADARRRAVRARQVGDRQPDRESRPALRHRGHADAERLQPVLCERATIRSTRTTSRRVSAWRGGPVARRRNWCAAGGDCSTTRSR